MYKNTRKANKNKNNNKNKSIKKNINAKMIGGTNGSGADGGVGGDGQDHIYGSPVKNLRGAAEQQQQAAAQQKITVVDAGLPPKNPRQAKDTALPVSSPDTISHDKLKTILKAIYNNGIKLEPSTADSFILTFGVKKEPTFENIHHLSLYLSVCNDLDMLFKLSTHTLSEIITILDGKIKNFNQKNETTTNPSVQQLPAKPATYEDDDEEEEGELNFD